MPSVRSLKERKKGIDVNKTLWRKKKYYYTFLFLNLREMFIRLQHENKMLHLQQEGSENERIEELQEKLEQKHRTINQLETENR